MFLRQNDKKHLRIPAKAGIHKWIPVFTGMLMIIILSCTPAFAATTIPFTINMSEAVSVTGTPRIAVDVGGVTRYATYASGTGTSALTFNYDMIAGDVDLDGVTLTSPIDLNGGTIKDLNGNDATLTFAVPNTSNVKVNYPSLGMDFTADADGRFTLNGTPYNDLTSFLTASGGTFTRASVGTYFDSSGTLQTAASGAPRFDYDPVTNAVKGILIEESRTNYIKNSQLSELTLNQDTSTTSWGISKGSTTGQTITVIGTGTQNGIPYVDLHYNIPTNTTGTTQYPGIGMYLSDATTVSNGTKTILSAWLGISSFTSTGGTCTLSFSNRSHTSGNAYITEATTAFTSTAPYTYRTSPIMTHGATAGKAYFSIYMATPNGVACDATIRLGAPQFEIGSFPTSYIPTTTAAVTRQPDDFRFTTASGWFNGTTGTWYAYFDGGKESTQTANGRVISYDGSTAALSTDCGSTSTLGTWNETTNLCQATGADFYTTAGGAAVSYNQTTLNRSLSGRGLAPVTAAYTGTYNSTGGIIRLGSNVASNTNLLNGHIQKVKFYPVRVSDTQLQLLTQ